MIEYYNDILCIEANWLIENGFLTKTNYDKYIIRHKIRRLRRASRSRTALVEYESMPDLLKQKIIEKLGKNPYDIERYRYFKKYIKDDEDARIFYVKYTLPNGSFLTDKNRLEYYTNAKMINAIIEYYNEIKSRRRAMGNNGRGMWDNLSRLINELRSEYQHTLPRTAGSLRNKVARYRKNGYEELISGKFGNQNNRKTNKLIEQLIMSLYVMEGKPYEEDVWKAYINFITGEEQIFIKRGERAGEILDVNDFTDKNGEPVLISVGTVRNILLKYRDVVDKKRNDWLYFNNIHRPHHQRRAAKYSLSKLSLDDRDLPPLLTDGKHIKAYFVWDAMSEVILGVAFSKTKDELLFIDAMQDAFRNIHKFGLGMPLEVEVEHHLVIKFKEQLEAIFSFVRWGNPGNAQEKKAERNNKHFKYAYEKKQFPTGRFYAKLEANRPKVTKIWTEKGMATKQDRYLYKDLVAIYRQMIEKYNNDKHSTLDMSRIDALKNNVNPKATSLPMPVITKAFGYKTETSLRRSQYVRVQYQNYTLSDPEIIRRIDKKSKLFAYYIPEIDGTINEVYLYQNGNYITSCKLIEKYSEARAEWDDKNKDEEKYTKQATYVAKFDKMQKQEAERLLNLDFIPKDEPEELQEVESYEVVTIDEDTNEEWNEILTDNTDYATVAKNQI